MPVAGQPLSGVHDGRPLADDPTGVEIHLRREIHSRRESTPTKIDVLPFLDTRLRTVRRVRKAGLRQALVEERSAQGMDAVHPQGRTAEKRKLSGQLPPRVPLTPFDRGRRGA